MHQEGDGAQELELFKRPAEKVLRELMIYDVVRASPWRTMSYWYDVVRARRTTSCATSVLYNVVRLTYDIVRRQEYRWLNHDIELQSPGLQLRYPSRRNFDIEAFLVCNFDIEDLDFDIEETSLSKYY